MNAHPGRSRLRVRLLLSGLLSIGIFTAALLAVAGNLHYRQAVVFGATNAVLLAVLALRYGDRLGLIAARMRPAPNTKSWDRPLMAAFMALAGAVILVAALDGGRFRWTGPLPLWVYPPVVLAYCGAAAVHLWAILANEFYVSTVAVQNEKGQRAVDTGPYRLVRHPGYLGIMGMELTIPLILGSLWALVVSALASSLLLARAVLEDAVLHRELQGYADYAARVRYRLIPGVW